MARSKLLGSIKALAALGNGTQSTPHRSELSGKKQSMIDEKSTTPIFGWDKYRNKRQSGAFGSILRGVRLYRKMEKRRRRYGGSIIGGRKLRKMAAASARG
jgi:hypothetical protein